MSFEAAMSHSFNLSNILVDLTVLVLGAALIMIIYTFYLILRSTDPIKVFLHKTLGIDFISKSPILNKKIFIVHGHNNEKKLETFQLLTNLGLVPIILHEVANNGRTIIEKFEHSSDVGFAIVLLTNDDKGKSLEEKNYNLRARQNVVLELGYFFGKLGRKKVCALCADGIELPTDISGLLHIPLDKNGAWKTKVAKELQSAGFDINLNNL